jgi:nucleoside-diphosphate-sugar epimerase
MGALIGKFSRAAEEDLPEVEVWGNGEQEREFLFVEDAVEGIVEAAQHAQSPVLNLGLGRASKIREIAEALRAATGFRGRIRYNEQRFVGAMHRSLDVTRVRAELAWRPRVSLAEGIRRTLAWRAQERSLARTS